MISKEKIKKINSEIYKAHINKVIRAIIIYGSWARGDNDKNSDIDILVICELYTENVANKIEECIERVLYEYQTDISIYSSKKYEVLLGCRALFLHHIYAEGEIIYVRSKKYTKDYLFGKLKEFKGISEDMLLYDRMLDKTKYSISVNCINYFDLNILALLARNTMILICYFFKEAKYGKNEVYEKCSQLLGKKFEFDNCNYLKLMEYRSYYNRKNIIIELPSKEEINEYICQIEQLIKLGLKEMHISNSIDRLYYLLNDNPGHNLYTSYEIFTDFDRDLYMYLNKYMVKKYNVKIDSIARPFIEEMYEKYNDDFVRTIYRIFYKVKELKKNSSNYSIDCPDIYSEINSVSIKSYHNVLDKLLEFLCNNKILCKGLNRFIKQEKTIIDELQCLRKYIEKNLTSN